MDDTEVLLKASRFVLLAPDTATVPSAFRNVTRDTAGHARMLSDMQVMRGAVALKEGAVRAQDLDAERRHSMPGDSESWHLLRVGEDGEVRGCARVLVHQERVPFSALRLSHSSVARSAEWGQKVRFAVEAEIAAARGASLTLVEPGGWVLDEKLRGSQDAVSIALSVFAWSQLMGGCLAYVTATVKHGSSSILKRLGGALVQFDGETVPRYYDPEYGCEMELIRLDTASLNPRFEPLMGTLRNMLAASTVVQPRAAAFTARAGAAA